MSERTYKSLLLTFALVGFISACSSMFNKAKTALDVVTIACIIANATSTDETVQKACEIADDLAPAMREVLKSHRAAVARTAAPKCP